ncbi:MAG TPA: hypothetical protein VLE19_01410 [Pyrinomonadaceae bacterium]|nr:hypothetical protein [Pyrinomonadaceae bacterium]
MTITSSVVDETSETLFVEDRNNVGSAELLPDLPPTDDVSVAGGELAGQTVRLRIATVNNQGK